MSPGTQQLAIPENWLLSQFETTQLKNLCFSINTILAYLIFLEDAWQIDFLR